MATLKVTNIEGNPTLSVDTDITTASGVDMTLEGNLSAGGTLAVTGTTALSNTLDFPSGSAITGVGAVTTTGLVTAGGGVTTGNSAVNAGTGTGTFGTVACTSLTVGGDSVTASASALKAFGTVVIANTAVDGSPTFLAGSLNCASVAHAALTNLITITFTTAMDTSTYTVLKSHNSTAVTGIDQTLTTSTITFNYGESSSGSLDVMFAVLEV